MLDLARRCDAWNTALVAHNNAGDSQAAMELCIEIYTALQRPLADREQHLGHESFGRLVDLLTVMQPVTDVRGILSFGARIMSRRPGRPAEEDADGPAKPTESTPKVIELFSLLANHAYEGSASMSNQNVLHLLRQIVAQHAEQMTAEQMRPLLAHSAELTWRCRTATDVNGETTRPVFAILEHQERLQESITTDTLPNQAWVGLLQHYFPYGLGELNPEFVLAENTRGVPQDFDRFAKRIVEFDQAGIKIPMQRTDFLLIAQILERMALIAATEAGTIRAQTIAQSITALVNITVSDLKKINNKNSMLHVPSAKVNPMQRTTVFNQYSLQPLQSTAVPMPYPEASQALERFRFDVLLHTAAVSDTFRKKNPSYRDKDHLNSLVELCANSLLAPKSLSRVAPAVRQQLVIEMPDGPVRQHLIKNDAALLKTAFTHDLGL